MSLPTRRKSVQIGNVTFTFICTPEPGETEYLDTRVEINGIYFCTISFNDQEDFINDISRAVGKYAI